MPITRKADYLVKVLKKLASPRSGRAGRPSGRGAGRWRLGLAALAALGLVAVIAIPGATPASANSYAWFQNVRTGSCLDGNYGSAYVNPCWNPDVWQNWSYDDGQDGLRIINLSTGYCLDSNANGNVYTNPCWYPDTYQDWLVNPETDGNGGARIVNVQTGRCLDSSNGNLYTSPCYVPDNYQDWEWTGGI